MNINTASAEVIGLLPGMEPYLAGEIVNYRSSEFGPFRDLGQLNTPELGAPPELISDIRRIRRASTGRSSGELPSVTLEYFIFTASRGRFLSAAL